MANGTKELDLRDPTAICRRVEALLAAFETKLGSDNQRSRVRALAPVIHSLRLLGRSLDPGSLDLGARDRILKYLLAYPGTIIDGDELLVVSGIQEYARRVRELRVEFGWNIASGITMKESSQEGIDEQLKQFQEMVPNQYVLLATRQDLEAARRWKTAHEIRRGRGSVREKLLCFLRENVGLAVTAEELRYVAGGDKEWAGRLHDLRSKLGWPVATRSTGRPDLDVGVYVLEADQQSPSDDRIMPDETRRAVFERDRYRCVVCGWTRSRWKEADPRHLEPHRVLGMGTADSNAVGDVETLCSVCHRAAHLA